MSEPESAEFLSESPSPKRVLVWGDVLSPFGRSVIEVLALAALVAPWSYSSSDGERLRVFAASAPPRLASTPDEIPFDLVTDSCTNEEVASAPSAPQVELDAIYLQSLSLQDVQAWIKDNLRDGDSFLCVNPSTFLELFEINEYCRDAGILFLVTTTRGPCGCLFVDVGDELLMPNRSVSSKVLHISRLIGGGEKVEGVEHNQSLDVLLVKSIDDVLALNYDPSHQNFVRFDPPLSDELDRELPYAPSGDVEHMFQVTISSDSFTLPSERYELPARASGQTWRESLGLFDDVVDEIHAQVIAAASLDDFDRIQLDRNDGVSIQLYVIEEDSVKFEVCRHNCPLMLDAIDRINAVEGPLASVLSVCVDELLSYEGRCYVVRSERNFHHKSLENQVKSPSCIVSGFHKYDETQLRLHRVMMWLERTNLEGVVIDDAVDQFGREMMGEPLMGEEDENERMRADGECLRSILLREDSPAAVEHLIASMAAYVLRSVFWFHSSAVLDWQFMFFNWPNIPWEDPVSVSPLKLLMSVSAEVIPVGFDLSRHFGRKRGEERLQEAEPEEEGAEEADEEEGEVVEEERGEVVEDADEEDEDSLEENAEAFEHDAVSSACWRSSEPSGSCDSLRDSIVCPSVIYNDNDEIGMEFSDGFLVDFFGAPSSGHAFAAVCLGRMIAERASLSPICIARQLLGASACHYDWEFEEAVQSEKARIVEVMREFEGPLLQLSSYQERLLNSLASTFYPDVHAFVGTIPLSEVPKWFGGSPLDPVCTIRSRMSVAHLENLLWFMKVDSMMFRSVYVLQLKQNGVSRLSIALYYRPDSDTFLTFRVSEKNLSIIVGLYVYDVQSLIHSMSLNFGDEWSMECYAVGTDVASTNASVDKFDRSMLEFRSLFEYEWARRSRVLLSVPLQARGGPLRIIATVAEYQFVLCHSLRSMLIEDEDPDDVYLAATEFYDRTTLEMKLEGEFYADSDFVEELHSGHSTVTVLDCDILLRRGEPKNETSQKKNIWDFCEKKNAEVATLVIPCIQVPHEWPVINSYELDNADEIKHLFDRIEELPEEARSRFREGYPGIPCDGMGLESIVRLAKAQKNASIPGGVKRRPVRKRRAELREEFEQLKHERTAIQLKIQSLVQRGIVDRVIECGCRVNAMGTPCGLVNVVLIYALRKGDRNKTSEYQIVDWILTGMREPEEEEGNERVESLSGTIVKYSFDDWLTDFVLLDVGPVVGGGFHHENVSPRARVPPGYPAPLCYLHSQSTNSKSFSKAIDSNEWEFFCFHLCRAKHLDRRNEKQARLYEVRKTRAHNLMRLRMTKWYRERFRNRVSLPLWRESYAGWILRRVCHDLVSCRNIQNGETGWKNSQTAVDVELDGEVEEGEAEVETDEEDSS